MSHIPNDKRARKSADLIFNALIKCLHASGILTTWVQRGQKETAEEINDIFLKLTGRCFKDNLFRETI